MEKYLWLEGDEGDMTHVTTYNTYQELFEAVKKYLVEYYENLLEGDTDDDNYIKKAKEAVTLEELYNLADGFHWGANDCAVFNFVKITEFGTKIL